MTEFTQVSYRTYTNMFNCLNEKFMHVLNCCETKGD